MMQNKRLLLIAPLFFNYYKEIIRELQLMGFDVEYVCDAPSNTNLSKAIARIDKRLIRVETMKYFKKKIFPLVESSYFDYVVLIGGMTFSLTPKMINVIKEKNKDAKFIMYQWDSEDNLPYSKDIHSYFDKVYSFDRYDCKSNPIYKFLPLFYIRSYEEIGLDKLLDSRYDCSYVGTAHPVKYKEINTIARVVKDVMPQQMIYHYMPSKMKYLYHKIFAQEFNTAKLRDFHFEKVPADEVLNVFRQSRCILDAPQAGQTGLTIRTLECLGAKKKLITTNKDIRYYDFYREENILIFDGKIDVDSKFFSDTYVDIDNDIYQKYALRKWLETLIGEN